MYSVFEKEKMLDSMIILVDTREQPNKKFKKRAEGFGYPFVRQKLDFGDYSAAYTDLNGNVISLAGKVAVERKMDANELAACFGRERPRFQREFERAKTAGARLYLIVENENWEKIYSGEYGNNKKYRSKLNPKAMRASILAWAIRYDVHVHFCKEETTPQLIADILHYEIKEAIEQSGEDGDKK